MTYRELFYKATRLINSNKITLGEYDEMTKPLNREIEQEPVIDKIRAEIDEARFIDKDTKLCKNANASGLELAMQIIDKYIVESEGK